MATEKEPPSELDFALRIMEKWPIKALPKEPRAGDLLGWDSEAGQRWFVRKEQIRQNWRRRCRSCGHEYTHPGATVVRCGHCRRRPQRNGDQPAS